VRYPLKIPPTVSPAGLTLTAQPSVVDIGGTSSAAWTYNDLLPGPTIRAQRGDSATITLQNGLTQETITHWHGMIVPSNMDGHPSDAVAGGGSYAYQFPINQRACMNWYHPHPHKLTGQQVCLGLAGAFIVNDSEELALGLPSASYELPLILRDAQLDRNGNLQYVAKSGGFLGNIPLVNGTRSAKVDVDSAMYRLRILNGANARIFRLALGTGAAFTLIGNDGGLLVSPVSLTSIDIAPAERVDVLVDLRNFNVGEHEMLRDLRAGWDLLDFVVTNKVTVNVTVPSTLSAIPRLSNPVVTRVFSFDGMSKINGKVFEMQRIDFSIPLGQTELWRFRTNGNAPHPVHVHGAPFQVQSRSGGRGALFPWEKGWKDTVLLEDGESVEVLVRFDGYRGVYLMHCHKLEHEDMGMMLNFEVV
jgi:FtsP/CotA-like multicopper oxidase with cupredoxin domain